MPDGRRYRSDLKEHKISVKLSLAEFRDFQKWHMETQEKLDILK
ncbi:hypothetical protein [Anaerosporobacter sp.]|nr:hypothetical protein [Anaerosporobacter sp.]